MDKKNTLFGLIFLLAGFGLMFWQSQHLVPAASVTPSHEVVATEPSAEPAFAYAQVAQASIVQAVKEPAKPEVIHSQTETLYTLENDAISIRFTDLGGAIKDIALKQFPLELGEPKPFIFNAETDVPALSIALSDGHLPSQFSPTYTLIDHTDASIRFRHTTDEGLQIIRAYSLAKNAQDPYVITHETRFTNKSHHTFDLKRIFVNVGSFPETEGDTLGEYLNFGYYNGKDASFVKITEFQDSNGILGIGSRKAAQHVLVESTKPIYWASVKNQFFASVLTPTQPSQGIFVRPTTLRMANSPDEGITGSLLFQLGTLAPSESTVLGMDYYVGPKELRRLEGLGNNQELIMQFGFFGFISKLLLSVMLMINQLIPNWGLTIIAVTILIKLALWPLTTAQVRSAKRMAQLQEPLKALKEKYANNPQKLQSETMQLFKTHKVNPAAGCLPLLVQLPIFLGLYFMLRTSAELRFEPFLWIRDLSVPDTVASIAGFPINPLPLLMGITMWWQMKTTPSPSTDDMQRKIFQFMPFIFLFFCYHFPSGLVLYWTVQNLLTIAQQSLANKAPEPVVIEQAPSKKK